MICKRDFSRSDIELIAAASGAEGGAVGLALGGCLFVFHFNAGCGALSVTGVVLAVGDIAADAGYLAVPGFHFAHILYLL